MAIAKLEGQGAIGKGDPAMSLVDLSIERARRAVITDTVIYIVHENSYDRNSYRKFDKGQQGKLIVAADKLAQSKLIDTRPSDLMVATAAVVQIAAEQIGLAHFEIRPETVTSPHSRGDYFLNVKLPDSTDMEATARRISDLIPQLREQ